VRGRSIGICSESAVHFSSSGETGKRVAIIRQTKKRKSTKLSIKCQLKEEGGEIGSNKRRLGLFYAVNFRTKITRRSKHSGSAVQKWVSGEKEKRRYNGQKRVIVFVWVEGGRKSKLEGAGKENPSIFPSNEYFKSTAGQGEETVLLSWSLGAREKG